MADGERDKLDHLSDAQAEPEEEEPTYEEAAEANEAEDGEETEDGEEAEDDGGDAELAEPPAIRRTLIWSRDGWGGGRGAETPTDDVSNPRHTGPQRVVIWSRSRDLAAAEARDEEEEQPRRRPRVRILTIDGGEPGVVTATPWRQHQPS